MAKSSAIAVDLLMSDQLLNAQRVLWQTFQGCAQARFELSVALTELERLVGRGCKGLTKSFCSMTS